ncbi:MAG: bacillithiol biosynthesis BshC, partial [Balneolales bacterium]
MEIQDISFSDLSFSTLYSNFTSDFEKLQEYYEVNPFSDEQLKELAQGQTFNGNREELADNLTRFNKPFNLQPTARANLESLRDPDTLTVATGQQMMVYGGPLFTVYKTITIILLARKLSETTGKKVIPVFWLADEDHDYEEVSCIKIPQIDSIESIKLPPKQNQHSVGRVDVSDSLRSFRDEVKKSLPETDFSAELWELLDDAYSNGGLKDGFARL